MARHRAKLAARLAVIALALCPLATIAQTDNPKFREVLSAVVHLRAEIPATARTAEVLGTEREGSGVVISPDGLIVTIGYLILEASRAEVTLDSGKTVPVNILAYDHNTGFGLLRPVEPVDVRPMKLGSSAAIEESARVLVSGYGGAEATRPAVVVSRRVFAGYWEYLLDNAIFTAPPYPNFGGAALIGPEGELLGIGSLVVGDAIPLELGVRQVPGNMFVPIDRLKPILNDLLTQGHSSEPKRPWLGVYTEEIRGHLFVTRVARDGPASQAGIAANDIIVSIGDDRVTSMANFYRDLWARGDAGIEVPLTVLRGAKLLDIKVRSGDRYQWLRLNPL
ncbi:MAG: S1C family serine protease [Acidiferrobacterales bacterium]